MIEIKHEFNDDIMPGYEAAYVEKENQRLLAWGQPHEIAQPEVEDEYYEISSPAIILSPMEQIDQLNQMDQPAEAPVAEEKSWYEELPQEARQLAHPFIAPFMLGTREENPIVRGTVLGTQEAAQGIVDMSRDVVNAFGGDFNEQEWASIPQILESNPDSTTEGVVKGLSQFMSVFGALGGIGKGATIMRQVFAGGVADATFDPTEGNIGTLLREMNVDNAFTQFLDSKVGEDATAEERLVARAKQVFEGAGIGFAVPAFINGLKWAKNSAGPQMKEWLLDTDPAVVKKSLGKFGVDIPEKQIIPDDYRMSHSAPVAEAGTSLDDMSNIFPDSPNDPNFKRYYGMGGEYSKADDETIAVMKTVQGNPDAEVIVYRAVPKNVDDINVGDWVSTSKDYATKHGENYIDGDFKVIERKVKASELNTDGDLHEWGWNPKAVAIATGVSTQAEAKEVRNVRNNNPGNIKDFGDKWEGMTGTDSGGEVAEGEFVKFMTPEHGVRALVKDITNKRRRGLNTIEQILKVYAPEGRENNVQAYIDDVATDVGIAPNSKLKDVNMFALIKAITKHEGGKASLDHFTDTIIKKGMGMAYPKRYKKYTTEDK